MRSSLRQCSASGEVCKQQDGSQLQQRRLVFMRWPVSSSHGAAKIAYRRAAKKRKDKDKVVAMTKAGKRHRHIGHTKLPSALNDEVDMEKWPGVIVKEMSEYILNKDRAEWDMVCAEVEAQRGDFRAITTEEVEAMLSKLPKKKCMGPDTSCCSALVRNASPCWQRCLTRSQRGTSGARPIGSSLPQP